MIIIIIDWWMVCMGMRECATIIIPTYFIFVVVLWVDITIFKFILEFLWGCSCWEILRAQCKNAWNVVHMDVLKTWFFIIDNVVVF